MGPQVQINDADGLRAFAQCLRDCYLTSSEVNQFSEVDNLPTLVKISNRLSFTLLDRWRRRVAQIIKDRSSSPRFKNLLDFVEEENNVVNSPLNKMLSEQRRTPPNKGTCVRASFNAIAKEEEQGRCPCCAKPHKLADCLAFGKMDRSERIALMRHNRLCDNFFGKGHVSRRCKRASACKAPNCKYKHHTLLHFQPSNSTALSSDKKTSFDTKQVTSRNNKEKNSPSENGNASGHA